MNQLLSKILKHHKTDLAYLLVLSFLWSIAFWDISNIINEFINENRFTLVKAKELRINETIPYLEDMEVCAYYSSASIFDQIWFNESELEPTDDKSSSSEKFEDWSRLNVSVKILKEKIDYKNLDTQGYLRLTQREFYHAFQYLIHLQKMDNFLLDILRQQNSPDLTVVDNVMGSIAENSVDPVSDINLDLLEKAVHRRILGESTKSYNRITKYDFYILCTYMKSNLIPLQKQNSVFTSSKKMFQIPFGVIQNEMTYTFFQNTYIDKVIIRLPGGIEVTSGPVMPPASLNISVKTMNMGIFDKSELADDRCPPEDKDIIFAMDHGNCKYFWYDYGLTVQHYCQCTPFTLRNNFPHDHKFKYCTREIYNSSCVVQVINIMKTKKCMEPCKTTKNRYDIVFETLPNFVLEIDEFDEHTRIAAQIELSDKTYTLYEEKQKMTSAQMVAQVGGDIGIYTGFSVLALWQFFIFLYDHWKKRLQNKSNKLGDSSSSTTESWYPNIMWYLETKGCKYNKNELNIIENLQKELQQTNSRLNQLEKEIKFNKCNGNVDELGQMESKFIKLGLE